MLYSEITYIYILKCPTTRQVRYVGKSNIPKHRYYSHLNTSKTASSYKKNWIAKLKLKGLKPLLEIISVVSHNEWKYWERYYIKYYSGLGCKLTNLGKGGEGLGFGNQTSFKKGQISYKKPRIRNQCKICGVYFEVSPSGVNKYKCCSMTCSKKFRSLSTNKGHFDKGSIPWNKGLKCKELNKGRSKPVDQLDRHTEIILHTFESAREAEKHLGISKGGISHNICGRSKTSGGFIWRLSK